MRREIELKQVFFIRHGETKMNRGLRHQGPDEPLTERGREQVMELVEFLRTQQIDTLIASNYVRARETADIVARELNLTYSIEPSVREFGRPLSLYGRHHFSPASFRYLFDLYRNRLNLLWNREGAENLAHVRERVRDAKFMIESSPGRRVAVISHRIFMTMFTETVCYDQPLSLWKFLRGLFGRNRIPNCATLEFLCEPPLMERVCTWRLEKTLIPPYNKQVVNKN